ncbi:MAG TPA: hypothetical protein VKB63_02660 [Gemmatimonadales bacterium]|nr:hypothetical protein [Gemmatimonadales bacterium]
MRTIPAASWAVLLVACLHNEGPPTTNNPPPISPPFATTTIDSTVGSIATTSLVVDVSQRVHVLYSQDGISTLRYATCAGSCALATSWQHMTVDSTANSGLGSSLITDAGSLHVTYQVHNGQGRLRYATCSGNCLQATNWQVTTIDSSGSTGYDAALAADSNGQLHVTYIELVSGAPGHLKYAFCATSCTTASNWQITVLDSGKFLFSSARALAVDGSGRRHLLYQKSDSVGVVPPLYYARCDTGCANAANWQKAQVDPDPLFDAVPVVALDKGGHPRSSYWGNLNNQVVITFATCDTQCTTTNGWHVLPLETIAGSSDLQQHSLVVDQTGRAHVSFQNGGLSYAECNLNCTVSGSWLEVPVQGGSGVGSASAVGVLPVGLYQVGIVYLIAGDPGGLLKFAQSN